MAEPCHIIGRCPGHSHMVWPYMAHMASIHGSCSMAHVPWGPWPVSDVARGRLARALIPLTIEACQAAINKSSLPSPSLDHLHTWYCWLFLLLWPMAIHNFAFSYVVLSAAAAITATTSCHCCCCYLARVAGVCYLQTGGCRCAASGPL